jgi:hypothetical protein
MSEYYSYKLLHTILVLNTDSFCTNEMHLRSLVSEYVRFQVLTVASMKFIVSSGM